MQINYELWFAHTHTHTQGAGEAGDAGDWPPLLQPKAVNRSPSTQVRPVIYLMLSSVKSALSLLLYAEWRSGLGSSRQSSLMSAT